MREVENIDRVKLYEVEGDLNLQIAHRLSLFASANYTHSRIDQNATRPYIVGNKSPLMPNYTINVQAPLNTALTDEVNLSSRLEARVTGPTFLSAVQNH